MMVVISARMFLLATWVKSRIVVSEVNTVSSAALKVYPSRDHINQSRTIYAHSRVTVDERRN